MLTTLILILVFGSLAVLWSESRAAAEVASRYGRRACESAGVQWLDQSVVLTRLRLRRHHDGRLRVLRHFRFEYSLNGDDRHPGGLALLGRELQWISTPQVEMSNPHQMGAP
jgi:hypothetical protein